MKNKFFIILLLIVITNTNISIAQLTTDYYLYVEISDSTNLPNENTIYTNNATINQIFEEFDVYQFVQSFPGAHNISLKSTYAIHSNGNVEELMKALDSTNVFDNIYKSDYYFVESCTNPVQINDAWIVNSWVNDRNLVLSDAYCAWTITQGSSDIVVGVADTEFDVFHLDLQNQIISIWGNAQNNQPHGTAVAGCIAAEVNNHIGVAGIGYNTKIAGYIVNAPFGLGDPWPAIWQAYIDGRKIINVSWNGMGSYPNINAVREMTENGTTLVLAAGNNFNPTWAPHSNYANIPGVLVVSGVDGSNFHGTTGQARNEWIDVCALSMDVATTLPNNSFGGVYGTSFAAPQVSGTAALIMSINQCLRPKDIENIIKSTTDPIADASNYPGMLGAGRLNAYNAVLLAQTYGQVPAITSNTIWNDEKFVSGIVSIEPNVTLTITSEIKLDPTAKIIVKQGAKLILDGAKLTNTIGCSNEFWQGIEVWGTKTASQRPLLNNPNQGIIELKNGAVIENAIVAIRNHKKDDYSTTGGIIICEDAIFRNNKTAVEFAAYRNFNPNNPTQKHPDFSRFKNTKFIVDDEYLGGDDFSAHVRMWDVHGIGFVECEFEAVIQNQSAFYYRNRFTGIHSIDASYTVNGFCDIVPNIGLKCPDENYTPSTFKGFNYAIMATSSSANLGDISVYGTNFLNNRVSMLSSGLHNFRFSRNHVLMRGMIPNNLEGFGILSTYSTGYRIEDNKILDYNTQNTYGIAIINSGTSNNTVYNNYIRNMNIGLYSLGLNRDLFTRSNGLRFLCNDINNHSPKPNSYDILVVGSSPYEGIAIYQKKGSFSAGNKFTETPMLQNSHIHNTINPFYYFYTGNNDIFNRFFPYYNTGVNKVILSQLHNSFENQCISNYQVFSLVESSRLSSQQVLLLQQDYDVTEYDYVNTIFVLNQMIDGGNTPALLYEIQAQWSSDAWKMREELLAHSPYLSQEALIEAALTGVLPDAMLLDVCIQNPRATMGDEFIHIIGNEIPNPLPKYMIDLIVSNWKTEDSRFLLEKSIAVKSLTMSTISDLLISDLMSDTISRENEILNWLYRRANFSDYLMIVDRYMHNNDNNSAATILSTIQNQFELNEEQTILIEDYNWFVNFRETLKNENRNFKELTSTEVDLLRHKSEETDNKIGEFSKNILCYFYDICMDIELPLDVEPRIKRSKNLKPEQTLKHKQLKVYPNPANDYVNFEWKLNSAKNREIRISTVTGVIIQRHTIKSEVGQWLWDTRNIKVGTYIYELLENNKRIDSGKLTVVK